MGSAVPGEAAATGGSLLRKWEAEGQPERERGGGPRFGKCGGRIEVSLDGGPDGRAHEPDQCTPPSGVKESVPHPSHGRYSQTRKDPTGRSHGQGTKTPLSGRAVGIGEPVSGGQGGYQAEQCAPHGADYEGTRIIQMEFTVHDNVTSPEADPGHGDRARSRAHDEASPDSTPSFFLAHQRARAQGEPEPPEEHTAKPKDRQSPPSPIPCAFFFHSPPVHYRATNLPRLPNFKPAASKGRPSEGGGFSFAHSLPITRRRLPLDPSQLPRSCASYITCCARGGRTTIPRPTTRPSSSSATRYAGSRCSRGTATRYRPHRKRPPPDPPPYRTLERVPSGSGTLRGASHIAPDLPQ